MSSTDAPQSIEELQALVAEADAVEDADMRVRARLTVVRALPLPAEELLARQLLDEGLELAGDRPEFRSMRSGMLTTRGIVEHMTGNTAAAVDQYEVAIAECIAIDNQINQAEALLDLGNDPQRALAATQRALQFSEEGSPNTPIAELLAGEAYAALGLTEEARELIKRNVPTCKRCLRWTRAWTSTSSEPPRSSPQGRRSPRL